MALETKKGDCKCGRADVTLYKTPAGWVCGKCLKKQPKRR